MIKEAMEFIQTWSLPSTLKVNEIDFIRDKRGGYNKIDMEEPSTIYVQNLSGIVDFINTQNNNDEKYSIIIDHYNKVSLIGAEDPVYRIRPTYVIAQSSFDVDFRDPLDLERFNIMLQSNFIYSEDLEKILSLIGNLDDELIRNYSDDGVTQSVTVKSGVSRKEGAVVPNPVNLTPYRFFMEIDQVESLFVFRIHKNMTCSLYNADGDKWKLFAIERIREYFKKNANGIPVIG